MAEPHSGDAHQQTPAAGISRLFARAVEASHVGVCVISWGDFLFLAVNDAFARMLGYQPNEVIGRSNTAFLHPDQLRWDAEIKAKIGSGAPVPEIVERMMVHKDGSTVWAEVHPVMLTEPDDSRVLVSLYVDITERKAAEAERDRLAERVARSRDRLEYLYSEAVTNSHVGHAVLSRESLRYISVNDAFARMLGYDAAEMVGRPNQDFVSPEQVAEDRETRRRLAAGEALPKVARRRFLHRDGATVWVDVHPVGVSDEEGHEVVVSQYIDVTEAVDAQAARAVAEAETERVMADLSHRSTHDLLTGLHNRAALIEGIEARLAARSDPFAVLYVDLDNFKHINDAYSHDAGDRVLEQFGRELRRVLRADDACGRIGGDEFVVVAAGVNSLDDAIAVAQRLQTEMYDGTLAIGNSLLTPRFSVGIALSRPGVMAQTLLQEADAALRTSKTRGKNRWEVYDDSTRREASRRLTVARDLQQGLQANQVHAHYQPIVDLGSREVIGYESLARWWHAEHWVAAGEWIGIADDAGLLLDVGERMVVESVNRLAHLPEPLTVALNASANELSHPRFTQWIDDCLTTDGAEPTRLVVEVTEHSLLSAPESARRHLTQLVRQGVQVHLDDFGTGYSSITHLRELPITGTKLDRSFTQALGTTSAAHDEIVPALAKLAAHLGLTTIAEGIEDEDQAGALLAAGWELGQGYLFGRPQPFAQATSGPLLDDTRATPGTSEARNGRRRDGEGAFPVTGKARRRGDADRS